MKSFHDISSFFFLYSLPQNRCFMLLILLFVKIRVFYEGHKIWKKYSPTIWRTLQNVKSTVKILSIFVAFLENMNFMEPR